MRIQAVLPGATATDIRMPWLTDRADLFRHTFPNEKWAGQFAAKQEPDSGVWAYRAEELLRRNPDFVTLYSPDLASPNSALHNYYDDLLAQRYPYEIAFMGKSPSIPSWIYPRDIDFLVGRMTIFRRKG